MGRKVEQVTLDGCVYTMTQLGGVEGIGHYHDLRKLALPILRDVVTGSELVSLLSGKLSIEALTAEQTAMLAVLVFQLIEALPRELELKLTARFADNCTLTENGVTLPLAAGGMQAEGVFDQHFAGRYSTYQKWFLFALKFNFASFLGSSGSSGSPAAQP